MRTDVISPRDWNRLQKKLGVPERQMDVIRAIILGHSKPKAIARFLGIRLSSAKTHLQRASRNLGVHSKLELAVLALLEVIEIGRRPPK